MVKRFLSFKNDDTTLSVRPSIDGYISNTATLSVSFSTIKWAFWSILSSITSSVTANGKLVGLIFVSWRSFSSIIFIWYLDF
nr:hypothetical protein [Mycoplasmopsis bovis]